MPRSSARAPPGAAAAILLARAGWSVALIERQAFPRRKVCGECVAASNLPLLDALGVGDAFDLRAGAELRHVALMRGARNVVVQRRRRSPAACFRGAGRSAARRSTPLLVGAARGGRRDVFQPWSAQADRRRSGRLALHRAAGRRGSGLARAARHRS